MARKGRDLLNRLGHGAWPIRGGLDVPSQKPIDDDLAAIVEKYKTELEIAEALAKNDSFLAAIRNGKENASPTLVAGPTEAQSIRIELGKLFGRAPAAGLEE